jgi:hypothetical protein
MYIINGSNKKCQSILNGKKYKRIHPRITAGKNPNEKTRNEIIGREICLRIDIEFLSFFFSFIK